jgi:hypothetical protein
VVNDSKRLWGAVAGLIVTLALLVRIGGIAVSDLASGEKLGAKTAYCKTGRYGPGPCIKGSLAKGAIIWELIRRADEWAQETGWEPGPSDA